VRHQPWWCWWIWWLIDALICEPDDTDTEGEVDFESAEPDAGGVLSPMQVLSPKDMVSLF
jgi:hypothetical protein